MINTLSYLQKVMSKTTLKERAKKLFKEYKENEDFNCHADNLLLLSRELGTRSEIIYSTIKVEDAIAGRTRRNDTVLEKKINSYYYLLKRIAE